MAHWSNCPDKDTLVTFLYDELDAGERREFEQHLARCEACAREVEELTSVRQGLRAWQAPALGTGFEIRVTPRTGGERAPAPRALGGWVPALGYAAAASLVLGVAAGIANLDVRYGADGLSVRTGWSAPPPASGSLAPGTLPATVVHQEPVAPTTAVARETLTPEAWRRDLAALEARLRDDVERRVASIQAADVRQVNPGGARVSDADVLRRIQQLIDESEVRQQSNLALRVAEITRDFDLQRKADLVQIQQGMGRLGVDAVQHQQMWDYFRRVSSQGPPR
ncbi:MAG: zf-HC2 domain-containing protein [Vicinamibacterales bacterium]